MNKVDVDPLGNILQSVFEITPLQYQFYQKLQALYSGMQNNLDGICIQMITTTFPIERSVAQKILKILMEKGLIERHSITLADFNTCCAQFAQTQLIKKNDKGCLFLYKPLSKNDSLEKAKAILQNWSQKIDQFFKTNS
jgi:predicted transcriptional regulator